ncbi:hypothetical protein AAF712_005920 [Marasmius tenuissimus]|uniref:Uncharacterized protein n=1 Tax=Marasmius tenuissimus TaxID=585030 RepID=A0ABR3A0R7_9AGAR
MRPSQRGDGRQIGSVEAQMQPSYADAEKEYSYSGSRSNDMTELWGVTSFGPSTFRHPFQVTPPRSILPAASPVKHPSTTSMESSMAGEARNNLNQTAPNSRRHHRPQSLSFFHPRSNPTPVSRHDPGEDTSVIQSVIIPLVSYIPVPPLLSLLYLITGHAILKSSSSSSSSTRTAPVVSSLKSGLVGGAILALPLTIVLYLLLFPSESSDSDASSPLDFFEDDESQHNPLSSILSTFTQIRTRWRSALGYVAQALIIVFVGTAAGPLGVTCLADRSEGRFLSAGQSAAAGAIGGLVLSPAIVGLSVMSLLIWRSRWRTDAEELVSRNRPPAPSDPNAPAPTSEARSGS